MGSKHGFARAGGDFPLCIILMIDGSGSMEDPYKGNVKLRKIDVVTGIVNDLIEFMNRKSVKAAIDEDGKETGALSPRYVLGIISYGHGEVRNVCAKKYGRALVDVRHVGPQTAVRMNRMTMSTGILESSVESTWFSTEDLFIDGGTPMNLAFREVRELIKTHVVRLPQLNIPGKSPIPLVVNITDGEPTDGDEHESDPFKATQKEMNKLNEECVFGIENVKTWSPVICNVFVSDIDGGAPLVFPSGTFVPKQLQDHEYGEWLFNVSHYLPDEMARRVHLVTKKENPKPVGFIWDASAEALLELIVFLSETAVDNAR